MTDVRVGQKSWRGPRHCSTSISLKASMPPSSSYSLVLLSSSLLSVAGIISISLLLSFRLLAIASAYDLTQDTIAKCRHYASIAGKPIML